MSGTAITSYKKRLEAALSELSSSDRLGLDAQKTVDLDQQSVGRLSRMDALQQQAMARATSQRRELSRQRVLAALARIDLGEYGWCVICGEAILPARLDLDPAVATCISCAGG